MATTDELIIKIKADVSELSQSLKAVEQNTAASANSAKQSFNGIQSSVSMLRGGLAGLGLFMAYDLAQSIGSAIEHSVEYAASLERQSKLLNISTEDLQLYSAAAAKAGVSHESFITSIDRLSRSIGEAASGNKQLLSIFSQLGINLQNTDGSIKSTIQVLNELAAVYPQLKDANTQNMVAMQLMGRGSIVMSNMLRDGKEALLENVKAAKESGVAIDENVIKMAVKAKEALEEQNQKMEKTRAEVLIPYAMAWVNVGNAINKALENLAKFLHLDPASRVNDLKSELTAAEADLKNLQTNDPQGKYKDTDIFGNKSAQANVRDRIEEIKKELAVYGEETNTIDKNTEAKEKNNKAGTSNSTGVKKGGGKTINVHQDQDLITVKDIQKATKEAEIQSTDDLEKQVNKRIDLAEQEMRRKVDLTTAGTNERKEAEKAYSDYVIAEEAVRDKQIKDLHGHAVHDLLREWQDVTKQMDTATAKWLTSATDQLTNFVMTGKLNFKDFANSIITDLVRIQIQKTAAGILGDLGASGAGASLASMFGFAGGGTVQPGEPILVGERGPEIFTPPSPGNIVNNASLNGNGGSQPINIEFINNGTPQQTTGSTSRTSPDGLVISIVTDDIARGGPINKSLKQAFGLRQGGF